MDYIQAGEYLQREGRQGISLGLDRMRELMRQLGDPQEKLRFLHIAGTNGKGSTASYLAAVLTAAGFRTGKYTSPAVFDFRERYQIDGTWIGKEETAQGLECVAEAAGRMEAAGAGRPTVFEQETALAFVWFAREQCDFVVLETGLGGDGDATNVISSAVCSILTPISLDHTGILGNTLGEIAAHKAGIIRPGVPVVSHPQKQEAMDVIKNVCERQSAPLYLSSPEEIEAEEDEDGMTVSCGEFRSLHTSQRAVWQKDNMALALTVIRLLRRLGCEISDAAVKEGWSAMRWRGRFEILGRRPAIVMDGAHNPDGAAALRRALENSFPSLFSSDWDIKNEQRAGGRPVYVMGVLADKDYRSIIQILFRPGEGEALAGKGADGTGCSGRTGPWVFTVASDSPRALSAGELAKAVREEIPGSTVRACGSVPEAMDRARAAVSEDGLIVVCGSLSFLKEVDNWRAGAEWIRTR